MTARDKIKRLAFPDIRDLQTIVATGVASLEEGESYAAKVHITSSGRWLRSIEGLYDTGKEHGLCYVHLASGSEALPKFFALTTA